MHGGLRLAELMAPLSLVTDLGMGNTPEEAARSCLLGTALARDLGLEDEQAGHVYWTTLLRHIGCTASAHEEAAHLGGDEIALRPIASRADFRSPRDNAALAAAMLRRVPLARRPAVLASSFGPWGKRAITATCEVAATMADRLGMAPEVRAGLFEVFERWDGKGTPRGLAGEELALPARIAQVATSAVAFDRLGGVDLAVDVVRHRAGRMLDPQVAAAFVARAPAMLAEINAADPLPAAVASEPQPVRGVDQDHIDTCARAFADMVDLKTPFTHGHSAAVADLAERAARELGLGEDEAVGLRRAGLLHDIGRVSVADGVWEKAGPLSAGEWEAVRLHAYHAERILARSETLQALAPIAGMHHERLDGSGYHRGAAAGTIPMSARILAAADVYEAMTRDRPHRPARTPEAAAKELEAEAAGRLDHEAVRAVLTAAGRPPPRRLGTAPAGLSDREIEVLRILAQGLSNREIARRLFISTRTAESHVQHIYAKIGSSTRAGAAMFAMHHDLLR
jgi:putative nucleotidyltransferase with HDIG domain